MKHGVPDSGELLAAVRGFLEHDVMPAGDARQKFLARVAMNVVAQVERELALGPEHARAHAERLAQLGFADDAALADAIRSGALDERTSEVVAALRPSAVEKLRIANPRWLLPADR